MRGKAPQPPEKQEALREALRRGLTIRQAARVAGMSPNAAEYLARRWRAGGEVLGKAVQTRERAEHARQALLNGQRNVADSYSIVLACGGARPFSSRPDERLASLMHLVEPEHAPVALRWLKKRRQTPLQWLAKRVRRLAMSDAVTQRAQPKSVEDH